MSAKKVTSKSKSKVRARVKARVKIKTKLKAKVRSKSAGKKKLSALPRKVARPDSMRTDIIMAQGPRGQTMNHVRRFPMTIRNGALLAGLVSALAVFGLGYSMAVQKSHTHDPHVGRAVMSNDSSTPTLSEPLKVEPLKGDEIEVAEHTQSAPDRTVAAENNLDHEFVEAAKLSFDARIAYWSHFLNTETKDRENGHHRVMGLVASQKIDDEAPLVPKRFNCTTFVETVSALSRSRVAADFVPQLVAIRYRDGHPGFAERNHFPETDWIPNNERAGILHDATGEIAKASGALVKTEKKTIDRGKWLTAQVRKAKVSRSIASVTQKEWAKPLAAHVDYVALADLPNVVAHVPSGTIVNVVHRDDQMHPVLITHQGFAIREKGVLMIRHSSTEGDVRTQELIPYLRHLASQQSPQSKWPLVGVNFVRLNETK